MGSGKSSKAPHPPIGDSTIPLVSQAAKPVPTAFLSKVCNFYSSILCSQFGLPMESSTTKRSGKSVAFPYFKASLLSKITSSESLYTMPGVRPQPLTHKACWNCTEGIAVPKNACLAKSAKAYCEALPNEPLDKPHNSCIFASFTSKDSWTNLSSSSAPKASHILR